jgi:hypothetical protein
MENAVQQGHLAALADAWLKSHPRQDDELEPARLNRAARQMSGEYFGTLDGSKLSSAISYQRQNGHHELVYRSYEQMSAVLTDEKTSAGGGQNGLRVAIAVQIEALNIKAKLPKT